MTTSDYPVTDEAAARADDFRALVERRDDEGVLTRLADLHPSDIADLIAELEEGDRVYVLGLLSAETASEALAEMERDERPEELLAALEPQRMGELLRELPDDDAADLIGELPAEDQARVLSMLPVVEAGEIRRLLQYHEESAGGIMTTELVAVSVHLHAAEAIEEVRGQARSMGGEFYSIYVVDLFRRLLGTVSLQDLVLADPDTPLERLVEPPVATVPVHMDQEEVGRIIGHYNLPSIAVVGPGGVLLGRVTWDDVIDVIEAEQTEDILRFGGLGGEEEVGGDWRDAVRSRLPWLLLNLVTAAIAASVVAIFESTIEQLAILAVIMPVIAGMGGNAGTQALAVTIRRITLRSESPTRRWSVAGKELLVGLVNGAALGIIVGIASYFWRGDVILGFVVLLAMWGNLVVASFAGAFVPVLLERLGVDPAVASSIFITTFTDLVGFFLLLGMASAVLL